MMPRAPRAAESSFAGDTIDARSVTGLDVPIAAVNLATGRYSRPVTPTTSVFATMGTSRRRARSPLIAVRFEPVSIKNGNGPCPLTKTGTNAMPSGSTVIVT